MSYFADLSPHSYTPTNGLYVVNVGWLDLAHTFPIGETSAEFHEALRRLCEKPIHLHRGFHICQFCSTQPATVGNGQIRVEGLDQRWFAAPKMIHHYVTVHSYSPPVEFVQAVMRSDL